MLKQRIDKFKQNILKTLKNFGFIINMLWKNSPWQCVLIIIIETLSSFIPLAYVYISKKIIDSILLEYTNKAIGTLILWCVLLVIINISGKVLANIRTIICTQSGAKINKRINELIIQKCLEFDVSFYDDKESYTAIKEASTGQVLMRRETIWYLVPMTVPQKEIIQIPRSCTLYQPQQVLCWTS